MSVKGSQVTVSYNSKVGVTWQLLRRSRGTARDKSLLLKHYRLHWILNSDQAKYCDVGGFIVPLALQGAEFTHPDTQAVNINNDLPLLDFTIQSITLAPDYVFQEAETGIYAKLWAKASETPDMSLTPTWTYGLGVMFSDEGPPVPTVYTSDLFVLLFEAKRSGKCNWGVIPEFYFPSGYALGLPQPTPFKTHVDNA